MSEELNVTYAEGGWRTVNADDVSAMMAELATLRRERDEARRLLDDARAQKPVEWKLIYNYPGGLTTKRLASEQAAEAYRKEGWEVIPLYAAAPVPPQPSAILAPTIEQTNRNLEAAGSSLRVQPSAVPEAVESLIPNGWVFYSADASIQSSNPRRPMSAIIKRDADGVQWWLQLTEEEQESTPLYSSGAGMTLTQAIQSAAAAILSAADDEVKK